MAKINIDFGYDDNVKREINAATSSLSTRITDYKGIKKKLNNMDSSTGNLTTANTYLQKKINSLQNKHDKLEKFKGAITTFNSNADAADKRVADRINTETKQFYKREGIQTGILYTIGSAIGKGYRWLKGKIEDVFESIITGAKTVWANIKQWYEDNKHWLDVVIDVVCVVAAVAGLVATILTAGGASLVFGVIFGVWGLAKAGADLVYDSMALGAYNKGDMEKYEELSEKGLKDAMAEHLGPAGEYIYYGMEIASAIYGIYKIGSSASKIMQNYKSLYTGNLYQGNTLASVVLSEGTKKAVIVSDIKTTIFKAIGIVNLDAKSGQFNVSNIISASEWTIKTIKSVITAESFGQFTVDTIKITATFKKIFTSAEEIINRISGKTTESTSAGSASPAPA